MVYLWLCLWLQQEPALSQTFDVVAIQFEGNHRVSETLLRSQTGLKAGRALSESQIVVAERRLSRLPFILFAEARLSKADAYGTYRLIFTIHEESLVFSALEYREETHDADLMTTNQGLFQEESSQNQVQLGARWFFGTSFLAYVTKGWDLDGVQVSQPDGKPIDVGLTLYQMSGIPLFLNLNYQVTQDESGRLEAQGFAPFSYERERGAATTLTAAYPIRAAQWIYGQWDHFDEKQSFRTGAALDSLADTTENTQQAYQLGWVWDTTDRTFLPRKGLRLDTVYERREQDQLVFNTVFDITSESNTMLRIPSSNQLDLLRVHSLAGFSLANNQALQLELEGKQKIRASKGYEGLFDYEGWVATSWSWNWQNFSRFQVGNEWKVFARAEWQTGSHLSDRYRFSIGSYARMRWGQVRLQISYTQDDVQTSEYVIFTEEP
ncbi:MAG: hypothetical protein H6510_05305 [Acidobacteria bacterium]|nr:hypothetical protein [Acidobacteriota bacterium]MCB9397212.1 hypothetical protein [Acidobacteriota bacterium]